MLIDAQATEEVTEMALINRMSRLLTADIHAVLDRIEEPEALLRQAIRDMEEELARSEQSAKRLEHERETSTGRQRKLEATLVELDEQLGVCFDSGNETLARKVVKRKLETEQFAKHLAERLEAIDKELAARRASVVEQREHLEVTRQKAELVIDDSEPGGRGFGEEWSCTGFPVGDDEVEVAFMREQQRRKRS
jgi:phage shock protein A